ncbi:MAG TPA: AAA family ATPase, partial [Longimicrobium sp.]|nr:AAA family ATPase [Longimicrobium sp.]
MPRKLPVPTVSEEGPPNIWNAFGLSSDPFFQEELRPGPTALYPVSLHVGREEELRLLLRQIGGAPSTRAIVEGAAGLGKTSLINKLKAEVAGHLLTHPDPVRVTADTTVAGFTADVLRIVLRIRAALELDGDDFWRRTARIVEGEDTVAAGVTIGPVGLQYEGGRIPAEAPMGTLYDTVAEALRRMRDETGAPLLIHVNNLENLSETDADRAANLLRDLRDLLLIPGAHWVFVGALGVDRQVFRRHDQVGGIFPAALVLDPLSPGQVAELLERRYAYLR